MFRFVDCEVDPASRELRRGGAAVHLEPQAFDLLVQLIEHRDRVMTKHDLLDGVWGHRFVSEANLTTRVKEARRAVGDDGSRQHIIKTVHGRGYRFVAALHDSAVAEARTGLIGREGLIDSITERLQYSSLVTLIGPGGVGKSSIARAVAAECARTFGDGAHVVELANIDSPEHVLSTIARAAEIVVDSDRPDQAVRSLANIDALLVIDNCEHLVDAVSELVERVLSGSPAARVRVLATSQVRLGLSVEQVHRIEPLSAADAVALFHARARSAQEAWRAGDIDHSRIEHLLASLDNLPLTIEMAAARLGSMTFDELEAAIDQGVHLLQVSHRSPSRRHRSIESLVQWSAAMFEVDERRTFAELSVFAGAVSAADVAEVVGSARSSHVQFTLGSLADRSLLTAINDGPGTRYRMLSTVRAVAGQWLDDDPTNAATVRQCHANHFAEVSRSIDAAIRGPHEIEGRHRLDAVVDELRAAHHWAQRHAPEVAADICGALHLASYSTFWFEPVQWARTLLAHHPAARPDELTGARLIVAGSAANHGDLEVARTQIASALRSDDPRTRAAAVEILSDIEMYAGNLDTVIGATDDLRLLGAELADPHWRTIAAVNSAIALTFAGRPNDALNRLADVEAAESSPSDCAWATYARGEALSEIGDAHAADAYLAAIDLARSVGNQIVVSVSLASLAVEFVRAGEPRHALDVFAECLEAYARHGNYVHAVTSLRNMVALLAEVGDDRGAAIIGIATSNEHLRTSFGPEAGRLADVLAAIEQRVGTTAFAECTLAGNNLTVETATQFAAQRIAHLGR